MAHFDPYWNKDNKRVSGMFQEASRRKEEEAAAAAETLSYERLVRVGRRVPRVLVGS